ncbi:MAG: flagellar export chaperone FliS [Burkholderiaceae bacterium]|nr:flagellar export chaperone FliS [Burkholderiaceae bacterium]
MFAAANPFRTPSFNAQSNAYQQIGVTSAVDGANPHRLVGMLYDGLLESIAQARGALRSGNVELKCRSVSRAVRIVEEGLKGGLDVRSGGALAQNLSMLYGYVSQRLTMANLHNDEAMLQECADLIQPLCDAWAQIGVNAAVASQPMVVNG